jgi:TM2 domain-containing membrane protein YozV
MSEHVPVYDLGEVAPPRAQARSVPRPRAGSEPGRSALPAVAGSLSLLLPGAGQVAARQPVAGLFFAAVIACAVTTTWALLVTMDRVVPTLDLLEVPRFAVAVTLAALAGIAGSLHVCGVLHAQGLPPAGSRRPSRPHPIVAGLASALFPGWGQVLASQRRRAALFLASTWMVGGLWLIALPRTQELLARLRLRIPQPALVDRWGLVALLTVSGVLWALAVYDAAAGAAGTRRGAQRG